MQDGRSGSRARGETAATTWAYTLVRPYAFDRQVISVPSEAGLAPGQVLLRTLAGGVCGSDLPMFAGAPPLPSATQGATESDRPGSPLHEVVGEVVASRDDDLAPGQRVVGWASGANAIADLVVADGVGLFAYDAQLPPTVAILLQPLACVLTAVDRMTITSGSRVAVLGQGPIGLLFSHVLADRGAIVTGVDRVDQAGLAAKFGAARFVHASSGAWARSVTESERPDVIVEAIGHQIGTVDDAVTAVADGGVIFYFGIPDQAVYPFPLLGLLRRNATLMAGTTRPRERRQSLEQAQIYLAAHPELATTYITDCFAVHDVQSAFERAARPATGQLKIVIDMRPGSPEAAAEPPGGRASM